MASKPAMDGKHRGQVRATSKEDKPEQQARGAVDLDLPEPLIGFQNHFSDGL